MRRCAAADRHGGTVLPILRSDDAPDFDLNGIAIRGLRLAEPRCYRDDGVAHRRSRPGRRLPEHTHDHEEVFHVLDGALIASLDGEETPVGPGDTVMIPRGRAPHVVHRRRVDGDVAVDDADRQR